MTAPFAARIGRGAGAPSHDAMDWQAIGWPKAHRIVRRLQARIVKATQAGRWNKVKTLQRLLTHSSSGKVLAVRRVTENPGKRTPGLDGEIWGTWPAVDRGETASRQGAKERLELLAGKLA